MKMQTNRHRQTVDCLNVLSCFRNKGRICFERSAFQEIITKVLHSRHWALKRRVKRVPLFDLPKTRVIKTYGDMEI